MKIQFKIIAQTPHLRLQISSCTVYQTCSSHCFLIETDVNKRTICGNQYHRWSKEEENNDYGMWSLGFARGIVSWIASELIHRGTRADEVEIPVFVIQAPDGWPELCLGPHERLCKMKKKKKFMRLFSNILKQLIWKKRMLETYRWKSSHFLGVRTVPLGRADGAESMGRHFQRVLHPVHCTFLDCRDFLSNSFMKKIPQKHSIN